MPAFPTSTPWCWSTTAAPVARTCSGRPALSPHRCRRASACRSNPNRASSVTRGEYVPVRAEGSGAKHREVEAHGAQMPFDFAPSALRSGPRESFMTSHARAALLMLGSTVFFGLMAVTIRLASESLDTFEVAFFRNLFGLLALLPLLRGRMLASLRTTQLPRYFLRSAIGVASMLCGFWAIGNLPLAQAVSLSYSTPLFVTIAAVIFLHEQVRARRWAAVAIGFIGVLVIVQPGS